VAMRSRFIETREGEPVEITTEQDLGAMGATKTRYVFTEDGVEVTRTEGDRTTRETRTEPEGAWLTPGEAAVYTAKRLDAGAEEISVRTIDPMVGLEPITLTRRGFEEVEIEALGRTIPAIRCLATVSNLPNIESVEFIDEHGETLRTETSMGMFDMVMVLADKELALSELDPPELMRSVFVEPSREIEHPRSVRRAVYTLRVPGGEMPDLPEAGVQRVEHIGPDAARVSVDLAETPTRLEDGADRDALLEPTPTLQCDDPEILKLAERVGANGGPREVAEALRRAVYRHVSGKALSVGFASASEVARTKEGDCTEHAVLLAAMLRARGIPSRVASGLIYADRFAGSSDIFGYHMWTQALVPDAEGVERWIDLDATLPAETAFDATHIALGTSELAGDSAINSLVSLAPLMGRLEIDVEEAR